MRGSLETSCTEFFIILKSCSCFPAPIIFAVRSPTRRATVTAVGDCPPPGFHSWLIAKGLTVVNSSNTSVSPLQGLTSAVSNQNDIAQRAIQQVAAARVITTPRTAPTVVPNNTPVERIDLCSDTENDKDSTVPTVKKTKPKVSSKGIETVGLTKLSKHFDEKMTSLEGLVPLSIFNSVWLRQDLLRQVARTKTAKEKLDDNYTGSSVPLEWKMSFGEWVMAFDLYVAYLRHYDHGDLADRFVIHKENVFAIQRQRLSWPMAFRYDLAIRTSVLTFRNADGDLANPAVRDETIEQNVLQESERLGDLKPQFADVNPYTNGQVKANINPISGETVYPSNYHSNNATFGGYAKNPGKPNARSWSHANQPTYEGISSSSSNSWEDRGYGSHGRNTRGRGRGGSWNSNHNSNRDNSPPSRRSADRYDTRDSRRGEGNGSWRKNDKRDDRRGDERDYNNSKYGNNGKAT